MNNADSRSTVNTDDKPLNSFEFENVENDEILSIDNYINMEISNILPKELKFMPGYYNPINKKYVLPTKKETENDEVYNNDTTAKPKKIKYKFIILLNANCKLIEFFIN